MMTFLRHLETLTYVVVILDIAISILVTVNLVFLLVNATWKKTKQ